MAGLIEKFLGNYCPMCRQDKESGGDSFYAIFRIIVSLLFIQHGAQKLLGFFGGVNGGTVDLFSLLGLAGLIELVGGFFVLVGVFTRLTALIIALEMLVAYFMAHFSQGFWPILNKGELALLYFVSFFLITKHGANKWSLEKFFLGKELF